MEQLASNVIFEYFYTQDHEYDKTIRDCNEIIDEIDEIAELRKVILETTEHEEVTYTST
ncbi:MAG: hypothetical protein HZB59_10710 [Ignavibacteriales bacterium]|nr:hypothetical protein [Ignavibacteriales bacterium]